MSEGPDYVAMESPSTEIDVHWFLHYGILIRHLRVSPARACIRWIHDCLLIWFWCVWTNLRQVFHCFKIDALSWQLCQCNMLSCFFVVVCLRWLYYHILSVLYIYIPEKKMDFVCFIAVQFYDGCKWSSTLCPDDRIRLFAHYITSLSSLHRRILSYSGFLKYLSGIYCRVCV